MRSMMLPTLLEKRRLVVGDLTYMLGRYLFRLCGGLKFKGRSSERFAIECDTCGEQMVS